ncbi:tol-pal system-associated acyl-CoA thioesterase [Exilibacterium tricleocarpae]|uniref:Tol-pal system-associated acyl-CoA thioesterase n=1 Tax=Exilibacterium tricleocarpae TaxID=2591008 RepID=A0A545U9H2_9GAMM|nr:tol-pal system-associated acyl-CoA thioesterase [Exilibacterium tricleocarpae]TQV86111.1 tol-pal system-associated acyl-CoA thioesterase [Exilibacterium tricleocarpae]
MREFSLPQRVYIEDTDAGGIVYYVNYLKYMERSRTELMRHLGFHKPAFIQEGLMLVVHSAQVNYRRPARLDEEIIVTAGVSKLAKSYLVFRQRVLRAGEVLCEGDIKVACVSQSTMQPCAMPGVIRTVIQHWVESEEVAAQQ